MNKMRICFITLWNKGGMIHYVSQLSSALSEHNQVFVVVPEGTDKSLFKADVKVLEAPVPMKYLDLRVLDFMRVALIIDETEPDVVHITANHPLLLFLIPVIKKHCIVSTIHDVEMHRGEWHPIWALSLWLMKKHSNLLFVHGECLKKELIRQKIDEKKVVVIPHGEYSFFTRYKKEDVVEEEAILFFGRILEYKGLEYLLSAAPEIIEKHPNTKILIAGEGGIPDSDVLKKYPGNFEIHNRFIPDKEVPVFFQRAAVVVLPYIEASQSGIIPIAYAFGKPVVASKIGCIPDVVEDEGTGLLVEPGNPKAISSAVIRLLGDAKLRKTMSENAIKKNKEFSWNKIADTTIEYYIKVLNNRRR